MCQNANASLFVCLLLLLTQEYGAFFWALQLLVTSYFTTMVNFGSSIACALTSKVVAGMGLHYLYDNNRE
jgi:hypothetical protein